MKDILSRTFPPLIRMIKFLDLSRDNVNGLDHEDALIGDGFKSIIKPILDKITIQPNEKFSLSGCYCEKNQNYLKDYNVDQKDYMDTKRQSLAGKGVSADLNVFLTKMGYILHEIEDSQKEKALINNFIDLICKKVPAEKAFSNNATKLRDKFEKACSLGQPEHQKTEQIKPERAAIFTLVSMLKERRAAEGSSEEEPDLKRPRNN